MELENENRGRLLSFFLSLGPASLRVLCWFSIAKDLVPGFVSLLFFDRLDAVQ